MKLIRRILDRVLRRSRSRRKGQDASIYPMF